jgi:hypothetical protein
MRTGSDDGRGAQWRHNVRTYGTAGGRFVRDHLGMAAVIAVALTAGVAVGYVGHSSPSALASSKIEQPVGLNAASNSTVRGGPRSSGGATGAASVPSGDIACPMMSGTADVPGSGPGSADATHLFTRTTADDVTIRAYSLPTIGSCGCGPIISNAPTTLPSDIPASVATSDVSLEMSDATAVGLGDLFDAPSPSATTSNASTEPGSVVSNAFGVAEGAPVWWVAVAVGPDVAHVQMTFADGSTDQMSPVDGVAVLAHQIEPGVAASDSGPYDVRGTLTLFDSSGSVITTVSLPRPTPPVVSLPLQTPSSPVPSAPGALPPTTTVASPPATENSGTVCPDLSVPAKVASGKGGSGQSVPPDIGGAPSDSLR